MISKGRLGRSFPPDPGARWRRFATPDELADIAAIEVALAFMQEAVVKLRARRFRIMNRASSRGYVHDQKTGRGSNATP